MSTAEHNAHLLGRPLSAVRPWRERTQTVGQLSVCVPGLLTTPGSAPAQVRVTDFFAAGQAVQITPPAPGLLAAAPLPLQPPPPRPAAPVPRVPVHADPATSTVRPSLLGY
jgi:hypothetical protein